MSEVGWSLSADPSSTVILGKHRHREKRVEKFGWVVFGAIIGVCDRIPVEIQKLLYKNLSSIVRDTQPNHRYADS